MMNIKEMAILNGYTAYNGVEYVLTQQAYTNDAETYEATAIRPDELDKAEDGYVPCYRITWDVINPDAEDEGCTCDWDSPADVTACGEYNIENGRIC